MQELKIKNENKIEIKSEQKKQLKKIGTIRPHKGHSIWKYRNGIVSKLTDADFMETVVDFSNNRKVKKVKVQEGALYVSKLNRKNAEKYFVKMGLPITSNKYSK